MTTPTDPLDVGTWKKVHVGEGDVYHCTRMGNAQKIVEKGIQPVTNNWGGGLLGEGFYTHKTEEGARNYANLADTVLKFHMAACDGLVRPIGVDVGKLTEVGELSHVDLFMHSDFVTNQEDENELKFHGNENKKLKLTEVTYNDPITKEVKRFAPVDWLNWLHEEIMCDGLEPKVHESLVSNPPSPRQTSPTRTTAPTYQQYGQQPSLRPKAPGQGGLH